MNKCNFIYMKTYPVHVLFGERQIYNIENVANLHTLLGKTKSSQCQLQLFVLPIKIIGATGGPTRILGYCKWNVCQLVYDINSHSFFRFSAFKKYVVFAVLVLMKTILQLSCGIIIHSDKFRNKRSCQKQEKTTYCIYFVCFLVECTQLSQLSLQFYLCQWIVTDLEIRLKNNWHFLFKNFKNIESI